VIFPLLIISSTFILISIIGGAFGAHMLESKLNINELDSYMTGIQYLMFQSLALIVLIYWDENLNSRLLKVGISLILIGTVFFSFSIFGLALDRILQMNLMLLGPITPIGGSLLIFGWLFVIIVFIKFKI
jgi:uncharacterized membrane protein YgdD (TMEM256/DUF423 family)